MELIGSNGGYGIVKVFTECDQVNPNFIIFSSCSWIGKKKNAFCDQTFRRRGILIKLAGYGNDFRVSIAS